MNESSRRIMCSRPALRNSGGGRAAFPAEHIRRAGGVPAVALVPMMFLDVTLG